MDLDLEGRVAWVLGGSSGLGRASALSLAREGARVAISSRTAADVESVAAAAEGDAIGIACDVTDSGSIADAHARVVDQLGPVDILLSNSGGPPAGRFDQHDDAALFGAYELLVASAWRLTKAVLPAMLGKGRGTLLYVTSSSVKEPIPGLLLSNMMRPAVVGMVKTLSRELGPRGIRALCLVPGRIATPRVESLDRHQASTTGASVEDVRRASESSIPSTRYGRPEEFGDVVAFLASDRASYMTGTSVVVDGGLLHGLLA